MNADPLPAALASEAHAALLQACRALLAPLAELAIARGVRYAEVDELLRSAFVQAALAAHPEVAPQRATSRVSTATGLHRREVSRLLHSETQAVAPRHSPATQVFTRWLSDPIWRNEGQPRSSLPRSGRASFETLAQSVTKDVHPRSLLEELIRLGLVRIDEASDRVELLQERFAPAGDQPRMLGFVASNVGDHLSAAVANVLAQDDPPHIEQAVFADELSVESVQRIQPLVREQWRHVLRAMAPVLQRLIDEDRAARRVQNQRVRVGLYTYHEPMTEPMTEAKASAPATAPARPEGD
ncbi:MAG TPA: DUF6502 family protein [Rhizobacter sp.]|nr:DUF6502 family protein [Rhizobacter sp.]